jgi:uncharacterized protein YdhG (YjbR/CyaY superfamily)
MAPPKAPAKPQTIAAYIAAAPKETRLHLRTLRKIIRAAAPGAKEELKWSMPAYSYKRILVMFAAFKRHVSLFPGTPTIRAYIKELAKHDTSGSTVRFPLDRPLPVALIRKLVTWRVKEARDKDGKWRT